jgi:hypothetical protein
MPHPAVAQNQQPRIRAAVTGDIAFISSTWKQSFWRESTWANRITWRVFEPGHAKVIASLLEKSHVLIACDPESESEILGYLVFEGLPVNALHFAYVKPSFRHAGVFTALLAATGLPPDLDGVVITHGTRAWFSAPPVVDRPSARELKPGRRGIEEKFPKAVHDPYRWMDP